MFSYNPGVQDRSGEFIAAGIQRAMGQIGEGVQAYRKNQADKEAETAAARYAVEKGWVKDEGEAKAAVKAAGGGRAALALISQVNMFEREQKLKEDNAKAENLIAQGEAEAKLKREQIERDAIAAALAVGEDGTQPTRASATTKYLKLGGDSATTIAAFGKLPETTTPKPEPKIINLGNDATGRLVEGVYDGNNFSRITPPEAEKTGPESPSGKLLADADRLRDKGRKEEADALRDQAMDLRVSETQRMQIDTARRQVADLGRQIAEIDERMAAGDTRDGLPVFGTKLTARREELVGKLAAKEGEVERLISSARRPLGTPSAAQPAAAAAPAAQQFTKGQRVIQNGITYEYDGANWNPVN